MSRMEAKKSIAGSECSQEEKPKFRKKALIQRKRNSMPIIDCECGKKILLIPDLKEMNIAIETHLAAHRKRTKKIRIERTPLANLRQALIEQLLRLSSQTSAWLAT